jgi:hypothetical protein
MVGAERRTDGAGIGFDWVEEFMEGRVGVRGLGNPGSGGERHKKGRRL